MRLMPEERRQAARKAMKVATELCEAGRSSES